MLNELSLINERAPLTPMESSRANLEIMITMFMLLKQIDEIEDEDPETAKSMMIVSAALNHPAEA